MTLGRSPHNTLYINQIMGFGAKLQSNHPQFFFAVGEKELGVIALGLRPKPRYLIDIKGVMRAKPSLPISRFFCLWQKNREINLDYLQIISTKMQRFLAVYFKNLAFG